VGSLVNLQQAAFKFFKPAQIIKHQTRAILLGRMGNADEPLGFFFFFLAGELSSLNSLAVEHGAVAIIHSGDFGFYGQHPSTNMPGSNKDTQPLASHSSQSHHPSPQSPTGRSGTWCSTPP